MRFVAILTSALVCFSSGVAAQDVAPSQSEPAAAPAMTDQPVIGRFAFVSGAVWTAANVFENENAERASPVARFNLAAAYAATGRTTAAVDLYRSAARDGEFTTITLDSAIGSARRPTRVNVADEASRRADALELASGTIETAAIDDTGSLDGVVDPEAEAAEIVASAHLPDAAAVGRDRVSFTPR